MLNGCSLFIMNICAKVWILFGIDTWKVIGAATSNAAAAANQGQGGDDWVIGVVVIVAVTVTAVTLALTKPEWVSNSVQKIKSFFSGTQGASTVDLGLDKAIAKAGYVYDPNQDIYYSDMSSWQRKFGYCRLYDEGMAALSMVIDCEPIYFKYDKKRWMIEFWKGQYGLTTGCEVGVYNTKGPNLDIPGFFRGTFYQCVSNADRLDISCTLRRNEETLFSRSERHWWMTGFVLGMFSEPSELSVDIQITLKDTMMRDAFLKGLRNAGYSRNEITINGDTVMLVFDQPHTSQPFSRTKVTDRLIQKHNKNMCDKYQEITGGYKTMAEKLLAIQEKSPELYEWIVNMGKTRKVFEAFEIIKAYL